MTEMDTEVVVEVEFEGPCVFDGLRRDVQTPLPNGLSLTERGTGRRLIFGLDRWHTLYEVPIYTLRRVISSEDGDGE